MGGRLSISAYPPPGTLAQQTPKILGALFNVPLSTPTTLYTVPASSGAVITNLVLANGNPNPMQVYIYLRVAGAVQANKQLIRYDWTIPGFSTKCVTDDICLGPGDVVTVDVETGPFGGGADMQVSAFGVEWSALQGVVPKVLGQINLAATANNDIYVCPAGKRAIINRIAIVNPNSGSTTFTLLGNPASGTPVFYYLCLASRINGVAPEGIPGTEGHVIFPGITLGPGDSVGAQTGAGAGANGVSYSAWGFELAA